LKFKQCFRKQQETEIGKAEILNFKEIEELKKKRGDTETTIFKILLIKREDKKEKDNENVNFTETEKKGGQEKGERLVEKYMDHNNVKSLGKVRQSLHTLKV
jgi:hypothetical protein